jgi:hypothetical protein
MKQVRKYMVQHAIQAQIVYVKSEGVAEAIEFLKRELAGVVSVSFVQEMPQDHFADFEI